jgi:hypothetical protein
LKTEGFPGHNAYLLATIESWRSFFFRETTARMASRTEELFVLPPPVGADIHSRGVKGARLVELSCTIQYEVSSRRKRPRIEL